MNEVNLELSERIIKEVKGIKEDIDIVVRAYGHNDLYGGNIAFRFDYPYSEGYLLFYRSWNPHCWLIIYVNSDNFERYCGRNLLIDYNSQDLLFISRHGFGRNPVLRKGPWVFELSGLSRQAKVFIEEREEKNKDERVDSLIYEDTDI